MIIRVLGWAVVLLGVAAGAWVARDLAGGDETPVAPAVRHIQRPILDIAQVRQLAALVTLQAPISDVQVSEITGLTGALRLVVAVHGDVQVATDLNEAKLENVDAERRSATLVLPRPRPMRPRLDHEKTRVVQIERTGMWRILWGQAGESALTNQALVAAQRVLAEAAEDDELMKRACSHTESVLRNFFAALDWDVTVQWK